MHMSWVRHVTGRLKSDFQYGVGTVYNTFPCPPDGLASLAAVSDRAQAVLDARAANESASLANLYDPDLMPSGLRKAHRALDVAVERLYRRAAFSSDRERAEHLFSMYEAMTVQPELGDTPARPGRRARTPRRRP